jgi:hypothetical protein
VNIDVGSFGRSCRALRTHGIDQSGTPGALLGIVEETSDR